MTRPARRPTATSNFGSGRRESHDATAFYDRFIAPEISDDDTVVVPADRDVIYLHDARDMAKVTDNSVALVVTSPPYFAGKAYEENLGENGIPATYFDYLEMLRGVFTECKRVLEPGGRIAVNVANLGRRPYRSLSADVTEILQSLGLLLRGEVVWWKGRAAGGSCAWGSFQQPRNPVLRDVTERVVIAGKGRFDRALTPKQRAAVGLPSTASISRDEFLEATTDLWEIAPEKASRVGHPAPFPVALPQRLIELYTYEGDLVLDPFMGSGSTAIAAVRTGRHYIGFDTDDAYIDTAESRVTAERTELKRPLDPPRQAFKVHLPAEKPTDDDGDFQARAVREGRQARDVAKAILEQCGFRDLKTAVKVPGIGIELNIIATDKTGGTWAFDVSGAFTSNRAGLKRTDTVWKALGKAAVLQTLDRPYPLILLTTDAPAKGSAGSRALASVTGHTSAIFDVVEMLDGAGQERLREYAAIGRPDT